MIVLNRTIKSTIKRLSGVNAGTYAGWFQQAAAAATAFLALPVYMKYLGQSQAGQWLTFQSLFVIVGLSDFGFSYVASRQTSAALGKNNRSGEGSKSKLGDMSEDLAGWSGVGHVLATTRQANLISCILTLLVSSVCVILFEINDSDTVSSLGGIKVILFLSASLLIKLSNKPYASILDGAGLMHITRFASGVQLLVMTSGAGIIAYTQISLENMFSWAVVTIFLETVFLKWYLFQKTPLKKKNVIRTGEWGLRKVFRIAYPIGIVNLGGYLISSIQVPMVAVILGPQAVAPYYLAQRIVQFMSMALMQIVYPKLPLFTNSLAAEDLTVAATIFGRTVSNIRILSFSMSLVFVLFFPYLSEHAFGIQSLSRPLLILMAIDFLLFNSLVISGHFVLASGKNPLWKWVLLGGVLNFSVLYLMIPVYGIYAIPFSSIAVGILTIYSANFRHGKMLSQNLQARINNNEGSTCS